MPNIKECPICGKTLVEQTWKAKSGKWYHAFRHEDWKTAENECLDSKTQKPYIEFIEDKKSKPKASEEYQNILSGLRELYLLQRAIAIMIGGWNAKPPEEVLKWIEENIIYLKNKK